ncbi:MAG: protein kinase domain-containing protein [Gemmatimonadaceae bacterium]
MSLAADQLAAFAGRYRIDGELGAGGMATVYFAHDLKHGRDVALKALHPDLAASLGRDRFLREIQLAARLSHPHILPLFDSGETAGVLYYVMPAVRGESLRDRLAREGRLPVHDAVRIAAAAAQALAHAHGQGIVHRDIKPENILLQDGHALVADFGIGKAIGAMEDEAMTQIGMSVGTPAYISPEQAAGEAVDGRSDQYSLACVLYEMLIGEPPFTGPNAQAVIAKRFVQTPADVTALRDGVPRGVARALHQALARTDIDRFPAIAAFADALLAPGDVARPTAGDPPPHSIAVLPFVNLSPDRDNEYLGDGIAEDIINALASIDGLHVAARASAFSFKAKHAEPREIGERLRVATMLEGSIRRAGSRIRITAQLMAVADGYQLWSERYDRELVDVFAVQDEIAAAIAHRLELTFAAPAQRASPVSTGEIQAYELLVRARALTSQRGRAILDAIVALERALALTPDDPDVHAALGNAWRVKEQYGLGTRAECLPRAYEHLQRALAFDGNHAEALGHIASIILSKEDLRRHAEGVALFERALALNPRLSELRGLGGGWGLAIAREGRDDERAMREVRRSIADDPLNPICSTVFAIVMGVIGNFAQGIEEAARACEREPGAFAPHYVLAWSHTWARNTEPGLAFTQGAMERFGRHPWLMQAMTGLYMQRGDRRSAEAIHAELEARSVTSPVQYFSRAISAIYLERIDEAFELALASARARDGIGHMWVRFPDIDPILAHPRYPEILAALGA